MTNQKIRNWLLKNLSLQWWTLSSGIMLGMFLMQENLKFYHCLQPSLTSLFPSFFKESSSVLNVTCYYNLRYFLFLFLPFNFFCLVLISVLFCLNEQYMMIVIYLFTDGALQAQRCCSWWGATHFWSSVCLHSRGKDIYSIWHMISNAILT